MSTEPISLDEAVKTLRIAAKHDHPQPPAETIRVVLAALAQRDTTIAAVRELHNVAPWNLLYCAECERNGKPVLWPCPTMAALSAPVEAGAPAEDDDPLVEAPGFGVTNREYVPRSWVEAMEAEASESPRCRYCGAGCSDGRSWDGGDLYACPTCADARAAAPAEPTGDPGRAELLAFAASIERTLPRLREPDPLGDWSRGVAWAVDRARAVAGSGPSQPTPTEET